MPVFDKRSADRQKAVNKTDTALQNGTVENRAIDTTELFYRLLYSWKLIICLVLVCAALAGAFVHYLVTPMFKATSVIYLLNRSDSVINMADLQLGSALTSDYIKVFKMWEVHEKVISQLDLPYSYSEIQKMLSVTNDSNTRMLDISIQSADPSEAAAIANAYAEVVCDYIAENMATERPSIMSIALVPANPVSPNKTLSIIAGAVLGGMIGFFIVLERTLADDKYKTVDDIRKYTGLPTLATIPADDTLRREHREAKRRKS